MAKRKGKPLRFLIHISTFKPLKGERVKESKIHRFKHAKQSPLYSSRISRGDVSIVSRKLYIPVNPSDEKNDSKINAVVNKYFKKFQNTKQKDFTVTVQKFAGEIRSPYTGKVQGDISTGAHVKAFDIRKFKREINKINLLRKSRGKKPLNLKKNLQAKLENIRTELKAELRHVEMKKYRSKKTGTLDHRTSKKKSHKGKRRKK